MLIVSIVFCRIPRRSQQLQQPIFGEPRVHSPTLRTQQHRYVSAGGVRPRLCCHLQPQARALGTLHGQTCMVMMAWRGHLVSISAKKVALGTISVRTLAPVWWATSVMVWQRSCLRRGGACLRGVLCLLSSLQHRFQVSRQKGHSLQHVPRSLHKAPLSGCARCKMATVLLRVLPLPCATCELES